MATFKTSAIVELIDKTKAGARSVIDSFNKMERSADGFGDEADKAGEKGKKSFEEYAFEVKKAEDRLESLRRDLRNGRGDFKQISDEIDDVTKSLDELNDANKGFSIGASLGSGLRRGALFGGGLLAAGGAAVFAGTNEFAQQADEALKLAQASGFAVESVTALKFALSQTVSDEAVNALPAILRDLNARIGEFKRTGAGELSSLDDELKTILASADSTEDAFVRIGEELRSRNLDSQVLASTLEKLFGEPGRQLVPFFEKSQDQVDELINKARQFGVVITEETAKEAQEFRDQLGQTQTILQGIGTTFFSKLFGPGADILENRINPALDRFQDFVAGVSSDSIEGFFETVLDLADGFLNTLQDIANAAGGLNKLIDPFTTSKSEQALKDALSGRGLGSIAGQEVFLTRGGQERALEESIRELAVAGDDEQLNLLRAQNEFLKQLVDQTKSELNGADAGVQSASTSSSEAYSGDGIGRAMPVGIDYTAIGIGGF